MKWNINTINNEDNDNLNRGNGTKRRGIRSVGMLK